MGEVIALNDLRKQVEFNSCATYRIEKIYSGEWYLDKMCLISIDDLGEVYFGLRFYGANPNGRRFWMDVPMSENLFFDAAFSLETMIHGFLADEVYLLEND